MIGLVLAAAVSWPGQYNAGVTAYRSNDFSSASTTFEQATASPDRALQERAFYNLGNTAYRLGEADPTRAQPSWERALKSYEAALAINPQDEDARFNYEFVKKKLEELKKQQEQQQKEQNQKQDQKKDEQQQQQKKEQEQEQDKRQEQEKQQARPQEQQEQKQPEQQQAQAGNLDKQQEQDKRQEQEKQQARPQIGRASCRERV